METHLLIHGWIPAFYGACGARLGNTMVYAYVKKDDTVEAAVALVDIARSKVKHDSPDAWMMSDRLFWPMARKCIEVMETR
jgi:hypothetical protein